tara:strand:- start:693 stop:1055 length:363 start_codon:yes stop_codon:yes gene_type:complete
MVVLEVLKKDVEKAFGVKLREKSRRRDVVNGRIAFGYIARKHLKKTYQKIGSVLEKDHATIIHYCKNFDGIYKSDNNFRNYFDILVIDDYLLRNKESIKEEIDRLEFKVGYFKNRLKDAV